MEKDQNLMMESWELTGTLIWIYAIVGAMFIIYSIVVFLQTRVDVSLRASISALLFFDGFLFLNLAGRLVTGYIDHFTVVLIIISIILGASGLILSYVMYKNNKKQKYEIK